MSVPQPMAFLFVVAIYVAAVFLVFVSTADARQRVLMSATSKVVGYTLDANDNRASRL